MKGSQKGRTVIYIIGFIALVFIGVFTYGYLNNKGGASPIQMNASIIFNE